MLLPWIFIVSSSPRSCTRCDLSRPIFVLILASLQWLRWWGSSKETCQGVMSGMWWNDQKSQHLLHNISWELLNLFPDVAKESVAWPPALEHYDVDEDFTEIHVHCCPRWQRVSSYFVRFKAETSASDCGTGWLQVLKDIFGGEVFYAIILPDCAHWSIQWCSWTCPDSVHKTCPLKYVAQNAVICLSVNDGVMFLIILLHFECNSHTI